MLEPCRIGQDGQRHPVRPQRGRPCEQVVGRAGQTTVGQGHGLDRCQVIRPVEHRPQQVAHDVPPNDRALPPEVDRTVVGADGDLDDVAVLRYFGFLAWRLKNSFHLVAAGRSELMICDRFRRRAQRGPHRGAGQQQVARVEPLEPAQRRQRLERREDHVGVDQGVLTDLAVDPQPQAKVAEPLELVLVQQDQRRPDGGEASGRTWTRRTGSWAVARRGRRRRW